VVGIISDTVHKPEMNEKFLIRSFIYATAGSLTVKKENDMCMPL
jgi:hypothetical protein